MTTRERLQAFYGDERTEDGNVKAAKKKRTILPEQLRGQKQYLINRLQQEYTQLKAQWGGNTEYDEWFAGPVNNAQLNSVAAYYDLVPGFERLLQQNGGDLEKFYEAADRLARDPKTERDRWLRTLASAATGSALPEDGTFTPPAPATMSSAAP
jgi:predicted aminopeptidase